MSLVSMIQAGFARVATEVKIKANIDSPLFTGFPSAPIFRMSKQASAPAGTPSGYVDIYAKSDDRLYTRAIDGIERPVRLMTDTIAIGELPVAADGSSTSTSVVRADDLRLSNSRTPTAHNHDTLYASRTGGGREATATFATTGTVTLDLSVASVFYVNSQTGALTFAFSNVPASGIAATISVFIYPGITAYGLTWPSSVKWMGAAAPTNTSFKELAITLTTFDGGTNWYASWVKQV